MIRFPGLPQNTSEGFLRQPCLHGENQARDAMAILTGTAGQKAGRRGDDIGGKKRLL